MKRFQNYRSLIPLILAQLLVELPKMSNTPQQINVENINATEVPDNSILDEPLPEVRQARSIKMADDTTTPVAISCSSSWLFWLWHDVYCLGALLVGSTVIGCFINHHVNQRMQRMGAKMRIACCSLIFRKVYITILPIKLQTQLI